MLEFVREASGRCSGGCRSAVRTTSESTFPGLGTEAGVFSLIVVQYCAEKTST